MTIKIHTALYSDSGCTISQFLRQANLWNDPRIEIVEHEFTEIYNDEWAKHQPFNRMPYLVDDETGFELYELGFSHQPAAIGDRQRRKGDVLIEDIATKTKSDLAPPPADTPEYWNYQKMVSVLIDHFTYNINPLLTEKFYGPQVFKQPTNEPVVEWHEKDFAKILKGYDRILAKQDWLLGNKISLVDILHANNAALAQQVGCVKGLTDGTYPNVAKWWKALLATPAYQEAAAYKREKYLAFLEKNKEGASH